MTGTPTNLSNLWKYGMPFQLSGKRSFRISTVFKKKKSSKKLRNGD